MSEEFEKYTLCYDGDGMRQQISFYGPDPISKAEVWLLGQLESATHWRYHPKTDGICPLCSVVQS
ncbi:hypothetical protein [Mycobacteroides abscessus]|uniref:hypothetical protein n=1 Tax=Mycobacteroides abscessus TaxID=36809 RepID=UPI0009A5C95B|nr:hypothetical protein [Mycobacteroides abscessus]SLH42725.1 Uncharacterised protein [Mycobacteroides abscessus subsp. abscessus]